MKIMMFTVGPLQSNCYLAYDEKSLDAVVIDPGDEPDRIMDFIKENRLFVKYIVCTHAHFDHIGSVDDIKNETGAKIIIHKDDLEIYVHAKDQAAMWGVDVEALPPPDLYVDEGDEISIGEIVFTVLHTPGHSPGSICLFGNGIILTGDTVFAGSVGRTDLYGGSAKELKKSFSRIMTLEPDVKILPGHGDMSTVGKEKRTNFFIYEL